jgi:hypothetical protein
VDRNKETVILCLFGSTGGILETQELVPIAYFTHKPTYAYSVHGLLEDARILGFGNILAR